MEFLNLIKERYSCKKFDGRPIDESVLTAILEAGRLAPTAKNAQAQRVYVLTSPKALAALDSITPCRYGAPVVLALAYDRNSVFHYPGDTRDSGAEDASIVGVHMMLAAKNVGVDSCWVNFFDPEKLKKALTLPENEDLVLLLDLGYRGEGGGPLLNHTSRKPLVETVRVL